MDIFNIGKINNLIKQVKDLTSSRTLFASVPSISGSIMALAPSLNGNLTYSKVDGHADLAILASGVISATSPIPVGQTRSIKVLVQDDGGVSITTNVIMTGYAAAVTRVAGIVTKTKDGSVGQTYTAPVGMIKPQWFRESKDISRTTTLISGAATSTYVTTADDIGFRPAVRGYISGVLTLAVSDTVVYAPPTLLESFDSLTSTTIVGSPTVSVDTANKIQGTGSWSITGTGQSSSVKKTLSGTYTPSNLGTLVVYWDAGNDPELTQYSGSRVRIDQATGGFSFNTVIADGAMTTDTGTFKMNGYFDAQHVSEHPVLSTLTTPTQLGISVPGGDTTSPMNSTVRTDALLANAGGMPTFTFGFDDALPGQYSNAAPLLEKYGYRGTWYIPTALVDTAGHLTTAQVLDLYARGHDIQIDGRSNDSLIIDMASEAAFVADIRAQKAWFAARGLPEPKHLCYPNGYHRGYNTAGNANQGGTRVYQASVTRVQDSKIITVASNTGIAVGMKVIGMGFPKVAPFARVESIDGTAITIDTAASSGGTHPVSFTNDTALFHTGRIQALMAAEGILSGRATTLATGYSNSRMTRYGEAGQALVYSAQGVSGATAASMIAMFAKNILRGGTMEFYIHDVITGGAVDGSSANTGINCYSENFELALINLKTYTDAGLADVFTQARRFARDYGSGIPV